MLPTFTDPGKQKEMAHVIPDAVTLLRDYLRGPIYTQPRITEAEHLLYGCTVRMTGTGYAAVKGISDRYWHEITDGQCDCSDREAELDWMGRRLCPHFLAICILRQCEALGAKLVPDGPSQAEIDTALDEVYADPAVLLADAFRDVQAQLALQREIAENRRRGLIDYGTREHTRLAGARTLTGI